MSVTMLPIAVGTMISSKLYNRGIGYVTAVHGEARPDSVRSLLGGMMSSGGGAEYDVVFIGGALADKVPESILRAGPWRLYPQEEGFAGPERLAELQENARAQAVAARDAAVAAQNAFDAEVAALRIDPRYEALVQADEGSGKTAAKNIRVLLKGAFPGVKFSVRNDRYSSLRVSWTGGPARDEVGAITTPFIGGRSSDCGDFRDRLRTPWNTMFGHADYVFTDRSAGT